MKEEAMDEMYRMLGREHEADLEREAHSRRLAATVRSGRQAPAEAPRARPWKRLWLVPARLVALLR
ncbi:MAG: hypothetical protein E6G25_01780 [Actinobacteria bacterium]|nr:MAG: hypothetical protein E6G25_01780 [Actinomycetota bacterium]